MGQLLPPPEFNNNNNALYFYSSSVFTTFQFHGELITMQNALQMFPSLYRWGD